MNITYDISHYLHREVLSEQLKKKSVGRNYHSYLLTDQVLSQQFLGDLKIDEFPVVMTLKRFKNGTGGLLRKSDGVKFTAGDT